MDPAFLKKLIGFRVEKIEHSESGSLILTLSEASEVLKIPAPWTFNSCLAGISSNALNGHSDISADLIGLEGAGFTGFQSAGNHVDLEFGSITISSMNSKPDLIGREDIIRLVDHFYGKIRSDSDLGPIFDEIAKVNWETHLPKMYDFWDTVMFRSGTFRGNPLAAHAGLVPHIEMSMDRFNHWLDLFRNSVGELFEGENADHIVRCAEDMANVLYSKINDVPDPRFAR